VGFPAALDDAPVGLVAVHGDFHAAAAGSDGVVHAAAGIQVGEELFEGEDVIQRGGGRDVAAIEQGMDAGALDALLLGLCEHALEVVDVGVDVAVGEQPDEMQRGAVVLDVGDQFLPGFALVESARSDGLGNERGALVEDAAAADGVVADFGVAHVVVGGHADGGSVGLERGVGAVGHEPVEIGLPGGADKIALFVLAEAHAVHDDEDDRALGAGIAGNFLEFQRHGGLRSR